MTFVLASLQPAMPSAARGQQSGAPDSLRAGLADLPEDWTVASPCDAATVIMFVLARILKQ